jgi:hypothetical protein
VLSLIDVVDILCPALLRLVDAIADAADGWCALRTGTQRPAC